MCTVDARDNGGTENGGIDTALQPASFTLRIFPAPRIDAVVPRLGPSSGGARVTIRGQFFGSAYSRGYDAKVYGNVSVTFGEASCGDVQVVADDEVTCLVPEGVGRVPVKLSIRDGSVDRSGVAPEGFSYVAILLGGFGAGSDATAGALALVPDGENAGTTLEPAASLEVAALVPSRPVSALAMLGVRVFAGGSFIQAGEAEINYLLEWEGTAGVARPVGGGLDAAVHALTVWRGRLIVGGSFTRAFQHRGDALRSPALAAWDPAAGVWERVGESAVLVGSVHALSELSGVLYVGGQFRDSSGAGLSGIARYNGTHWDSLGGGVRAGRVTAVGRSLDEIIIGGSFAGVGTSDARRIARWDGRVWHAIGELNGDVSAITTIGIYIYVAGDFTTADGNTVNHIARYQHGRWHALAGGVDAPVRTLLSVGTCLYLGGSFRRAVPPEGAPSSAAAAPLRYVARWCVARSIYEPQADFEAFAGADALGAVHALQYAGATADVGISEEICPLGSGSAVHCNFTSLF